jgi:hypothetical protein
MTTYDVVSAVLAFVRVNGPIGAVAYVMGALAATLILFFLLEKAAARLSVRKTFDIGGNFDHFYSRVLPAARSGTVALIFAGYVGLWLSRWPAASPQFRLLHQPYNSSFYGVLATLIVVGLIAKGTWELAKAEWLGLRWLRLEARGVPWHIADSGEAYRVVWLRRNGEYLYNPEATRDKRAGEELTTLRERRIRLGKVSAIAVVAIIVWVQGQTFIETFYPVISAGFVSFLQMVLPICISLVFFFLVIPKTVGVIAALLDELVYRSGAQFIAGAKLLEPGAWRLGRQNVEERKAHGTADFVTAEDAVRRMFKPGGS